MTDPDAVDGERDLGRLQGAPLLQPPDGGIDFHGERPDYVDFAYLALTIGMTFQVSDTDLTGKRVRRTALRHALTSYVFGTVIVAITVSSVAALLGG
jgi:uncharacterized membrane protein